VTNSRLTVAVKGIVTNDITEIGTVKLLRGEKCKIISATKWYGGVDVLLLSCN